MGSWNGTCAVTGLPILDNEEVEVILIKTEPSPDDSSFCNQYAYHAPLPFTFSGQYNEYGTVEWLPNKNHDWAHPRINFT